MKKKTTLTAFLLLFVVISNSQEKHEIYVATGGGISSLNYTPNIGKSDGKFLGTLGLGYNYRITNNWSIGSGFEMLNIGSDYSMEALSDSYTANDGEDDFIFHTMVNDYNETQSISFLCIPITLMFQSLIERGNSIYASAGLKVGVPIVQNIDVSTSFNNYGYYPKWENPIKDDPYFMGFGDFESDNAEGELKVNTLYSVLLETGIKWFFRVNMNLYSGVYCDYGLNNIQRKSNNRIIQYNNIEPSEYIHYSVINSVYTSDESTSKTFVDKVGVISVGLKFRLALNL